MELLAQATQQYLEDDFPEASITYTLALAAVYSDRAQTFLKLNKFNEALGDADRSLELDPTLTKSHFRRGSALFGLGDYFAAKAALQTGAGLVDGSSRNKFLDLIALCDLLIPDNAPEEGDGQIGAVNAPEEGDGQIAAVNNAPEEGNASFENAQVNQVDPDLGGNDNFQIVAELPRTFLRKKLSQTDLFRSLLLTGGEDRINEVVAQRLGFPLDTNELYPVLLHTATTEVPEAMNIKWGVKEGRMVSFLKWGTNHVDFTKDQSVIGYYWWADVQGMPQLHLSIMPTGLQDT